MRRLAFPLLALLASGCPPALRRPESTLTVVSGTVTSGGFERAGSPLEGATVTVRDAATAEALASNTTSSSGTYRVLVPGEATRRVVLVATADGHAPHAQAFTAAKYVELTWSFALEPLATLECVDASCVAPQVDLEWVRPPMAAAGRAQSFDVGGSRAVLVDVDPQRPEVLALAYVDLAGGTEGALALRVPLSSWPRLVDAQPGTATLEVPVASFDFETGAWTRRGQAVLLAENGLPLPESALAALQQQAFAGGAVVELPLVTKGAVAALGGPSLDGCVEGTLAALGTAAQGATVMLGVEPAPVDERGAFCARAPAGDGVALVDGQYAGLWYGLGGLPQPTGPGACGSGACAQAGARQLLAEALQVAQVCRFTGVVVDPAGAPLAGAEVVAFDESVSANTFTAFCGRLGTRCSLAAPSGADGRFTLEAPLLTSLFVGARVNHALAQGEAQRRGGLRLRSCPTEAVTLRLLRGVERVAVTPRFDGSTLSWEPARPASRLAVVDSSGAPKWELVSPVGLAPPLSWGQVPAGARVLQAATGSPQAGDVLEVELDGVDPSGAQVLGVGVGTRP